MQNSFMRFLRRLIPGTNSQVVQRPSGTRRIPVVTTRDVERIVLRDFPRESWGEVIELLQKYEREAASRASPRVQLAALKLSNGSVRKLGIHLEAAAQRDFRDVLVAAEYPEYGRTAFRIRNLRSSEIEEIIDRDWKQYEEWLKK